MTTSPSRIALALDVTKCAARFGHHTDGDVARDDREGNVESAVMEVHVGAAHLRVHRMEQRGTRLEIRSGKLADLERRDGRRA